MDVEETLEKIRQNQGPFFHLPKAEMCWLWLYVQKYLYFKKSFL